MSDGIIGLDPTIRPLNMDGAQKVGFMSRLYLRCLSGFFSNIGGYLYIFR